MHVIVIVFYNHVSHENGASSFCIDCRGDRHRGMQGEDG